MSAAAKARISRVESDSHVPRTLGAAPSPARRSSTRAVQGVSSASPTSRLVGADVGLVGPFESRYGGLMSPSARHLRPWQIVVGTTCVVGAVIAVTTGHWPLIFVGAGVCF